MRFILERVVVFYNTGILVFNAFVSTAIFFVTWLKSKRSCGKYYLKPSLILIGNTVGLADVL